MTAAPAPTAGAAIPSGRREVRRDQTRAEILAAAGAAVESRDAATAALTVEATITVTIFTIDAIILIVVVVVIV